LAEVAVPLQMFADIRSLIAQLRAPPASASGTLRSAVRSDTAELRRLDEGSDEFQPGAAKCQSSFERMIESGRSAHLHNDHAD
jgi:hypothetical protein